MLPGNHHWFSDGMYVCDFVCVHLVGRGTGRDLFKWPTNHFIPVLQRSIISDLQRDYLCNIYMRFFFFLFQNLGPLVSLRLCPPSLFSLSILALM